MAIAKKQPVVTISTPSPTTVNNNTNANYTTASPRSSRQTSNGTFLKRKPVKGSGAIIAASTTTSSTSTTLSSSPTSTAFKATPTQSISRIAGPPTITTDVIYSQTQRALPLTEATGLGMGMSVDANVVETPRTPKTFKQSQEELFSKLEALAAVKVKANPIDDSTKQKQQGRTAGGRYGTNSTTATENSTSQYSRGAGGLSNQGSFASSSMRLQPRRNTTEPYSATRSRNGSGTFRNDSSPVSYSNTAMPDRPREPRRRINSAQFKTPSAADMAELAQVVVANAAPPKVQNKLRKRTSTLSLTTTTFVTPGGQNSSMVVNSGAGLVNLTEGDYRQKYDAALNEAKQWEKKFSSAQNQIHYERERWEEKYGVLQKTLQDLENSRTEANVEKMNSLLDTVQQLQVANETFRKQLLDAGIEPDPSPAVQFHSDQLLVGENLDRTFLEQNEVIKERSLITNQKISHLSTELNNSAIAISQTINYVQLRYLTQMLDAAEHVTSQKRTRVMSNSFLSDMLSRGVKKPGTTSTRSTNGAVMTSAATQTPPTILTSFQLQQQQQFQHEFMQQHLMKGLPNDAKLSMTSRFSHSLMNLAGLGDNGSKDIMYRLKGEAHDDRSQLARFGIPPVIVQDLKGGPIEPDAVDLLAANRSATPSPRFQYASPKSSQLRIIVPDGNGYSNSIHTPSIASGSQASSVHGDTGCSVLSAEGSLRRSSSEISVTQLQQQLGLVKTGGKYPYPLVPSTKRSQSQESVTISTTGLNRSASQQFLSPEMAILYSNSNNNSASPNGTSTAPLASIMTNNSLLTASNIAHDRG
ncbi:hypothetical protein BGZ99_005055 [Dissophora globulifera]|uniref:Uncharacterized protein n=1 Tax=Dissophora globulifera TaxID=979702 RepID=A0A9P6V029_9FUNG|nr:hypothetical protein BGZ99_005055 [Dissophora globulifera]